MRQLYSLVILTYSLVNNTLGQVAADFNFIRNEISRAEDLAVLNWLTEINYGPRHSDLWNKVQPKTGQWFLNSDEYRKWRDKSKQTLFCPGKPGTGKSILAATVIEDLMTGFRDEESTVVLYIYCDAKREDVQRIEDFLASLLKQLCQGRSTLLDSVRKLYNKHKSRNTRPSSSELSNVLSSAAGLYSRVFIVVDALDECEVSCRSSFLSEIFHLQGATGISFFATSRYIPDIEKKFIGCLEKPIIIPDEDIRNFVDNHITHMPDFVQKDLSLQDEIRNQIIGQVDGMYEFNLPFV